MFDWNQTAQIRKLRSNFLARPSSKLYKNVVLRRKPVAGICSRCRHGATVADMQTLTRFCYIPFYWKSWKAVTCCCCGTILKSYR
ncbi:Unknown protein [Striga hermonthica]|uniref:Uncharacterized protein n=1 Tax=Striga hermonthica TaxID=68872 RepID=A0A9N7MTS7_STRHE|nr:Unknown protein [Striga hermonthica]